MTRTSFVGVMASVVLVGAVIASAAEPTQTGQPMTSGNPHAGPDSGMQTGQSLPSSKLVGLEVRNNNGDKLGKVEDLVINLADGKVAYVALSHGGVLGIGDKLFAIPFAELRFNRDPNNKEMFFALNLSKEKLDAAPGFDKDKWPDFANQQWRDQVDQYYRQGSTDNRIDRSAAKPIVP